MTGLIYLSIEPGEIVDSMIIIDSFSQTSSKLFTALITYLGANFLLSEKMGLE